MIRLVIQRLLESYFRHRWLYLVPVVAMAWAALYYVSTLPPKYIARATMYVQNDTLLGSLTALQTEGFGWSTPAQATVNEFYQLLNSHAFLRAIVDGTDLEIKMNQGPTAVPDTLWEARQAIWVQTLGDNLILIGAAHEMPRITHQLATSTIETYIQWKINLNRDESVAAQTFFADLIATYRTDVESARAALTTYLLEHPKPVRGERTENEEVEIVRLQAIVDGAVERLHHAENQEENARLALVQSESTVRQTYFVMDAAERPLAPERSKKELLTYVALFVMAGVCISATGIVGGALLDRSFRFPIDVSHGLHLPVLAMVVDSPLRIEHISSFAEAEHKFTEPNENRSEYRHDDIFANTNGTAQKNGLYNHSASGKRNRVFG